MGVQKRMTAEHHETAQPTVVYAILLIVVSASIPYSSPLPSSLVKIYLEVLKNNSIPDNYF